MQVFTKKSQASEYLVKHQNDKNYKNNCLWMWQTDIGTKGGAKKFLVATLNQTWKYLKKHPWVYETFVRDSPIRFAFDLDIKEKKNWEQHLETVLSTLLKCWNREFPTKSLQRKDIFLMKTKEQPGKQSIHGIVMPYSMADIKDCKTFAQRMIKEHPDLESRCGFDTAIYRAGAFRTLYSTKRGKDFPFDTFSFRGTYQKSPEQTHKTLWKMSLASVFDKGTVQMVYVVPDKEEIKPVASITENQTILTQSKCTTTKIGKTTFKDYVLYGIPKSYSDTYSEWINVGLAIKDYVAVNNLGSQWGEILFDLFSQRSAKYDGTAIEKYQSLPKPDKIQWHCVKSWINKGLIENIEKAIPDETVSVDYLDDSRVKKLMKTHQHLAFAYKPGQGKSTTIGKLCKEGNGIKNMVSITYRQTLAGQQQAIFKQHGIKDFECYLDVKGGDGSYATFHNARGRIVQIDSLLKIPIDSINKDTVIWLDEASALFDYLFTSFTINNKRRQLQHHFSALLRLAGRVIITDADFRQSQREMIETILRSKIHVVQNKRTRKSGEVKIVYDNEAFVIQEYIDRVNNGDRNIVLVSDSKSFLERLKHLIPNDIPTKIYTASEGDTNDFAQGVDESWMGHLVFYSPKITTGVDYNVKSHVYGFFSGKSVSYRTFVQMVERSRNKESMTISVTAKSRTIQYYSYEQLRECLSDAIEAHKSIRGFNQFEYSRFDSHGKSILDENPWTKLHMQTVVELERERAFPREKLESLLKERGYKVEIAKVPKKKSNIRIISPKELKKIKERDIEAVRKSIIEGNTTETEMESTIRRRMNYYELDAVETATQNDYAWKVVSSPDYDNKPYRSIALTFQSNEYIDYKLKATFENAGAIQGMKCDVAKYRMIQHLEAILDINDRYSLTAEQIWKKREQRVTIDQTFMRSVSNIFRIQNSVQWQQEGSWYQIYKMLRKCWRQFYTNEFFSSKRIQNKDKSKDIYPPIWNKEKIYWHRRGTLYQVLEYELAVIENTCIG